MTQADISAVIPSYQRGQAALESVRALLRLTVRPAEILLVDQTAEHPQAIREQLDALHRSGDLRWIRLSEPSIPAAMNTGLRQARKNMVLFLDDDIIPGANLVEAHLEALRHSGLVAGQVLQPSQLSHPLARGESFRFNSTDVASIEEFMGGNFSVDRSRAIALGGFDENFVGAAYRFEAEFAHRYVQAYGPIRYEPTALIHHLALLSGGTRAHGHHLRTIRPQQSVGAYYFLMKTRRPGWWRQLLWRPIRAVRTRHHLRRPWWIPLTIVAELRGFLLARRLLRQGEQLIKHP